MANSTGAFSRAVARMIAKCATVVASEKITDDLVVLTLEAPNFRGVAWTPGTKIQVAMGSVFDTRTYTPMAWDADRGRIRILGFMPGSGPGSSWLRDAKPGDTCDVLGPRHSLNLHKPEGPIAFFGDETALGLAYALSKARGEASVYNFEVGDVEATRQLVKRWDLSNVKIVARAPDDDHLDELVRALPTLVMTCRSFILTGRAQTIQRLKAGLRDLEVPTKHTVSKAYWTPGKTGLD